MYEIVNTNLKNSWYSWKLHSWST